MLPSDSNEVVRSTLSAELARRVADHLRENDQELARRVADHLRENDQESTIATESFEENKEFMQSSASSMTYTLGDESSLMNRNRFSQRRLFDRPAVQGGRNFSPYPLASATLSEEFGVTIPTVPRATLCRSSSLDRQGLWYFLAMILPLLSVNGGSPWRAAGYPTIFSKSFDNLKARSQTNLNLAAFGRVVPAVLAPCLAQFGRMYSYATAQLHYMARDQVVRDFFATAMDVVLLVYAIGFLILSVYQATL